MIVLNKGVLGPILVYYTFSKLNTPNIFSLILKYCYYNNRVILSVIAVLYTVPFSGTTYRSLSLLIMS